MDSSEHSTDETLDCRMLAEIEVKIAKRGKRNAVSRLLHAKNDKETIAGWRSDLARILLIFNVSSLISVRLSLTVHSQTELAINTNVTTAATHTIVSEIHRTVTENQRGADGNNQPVSLTCILSVTELTLTIA